MKFTGISLSSLMDFMIGHLKVIMIKKEAWKKIVSVQGQLQAQWWRHAGLTAFIIIISNCLFK